MEVKVVKQHIKDKVFDKFYIFSGDEIALQNIYINKIAQVANLTIKRIDSMSEIYNSKRGRSFVNQSYCYVIRDDKDFMKYEKAWDTVEQILGSNMLIFLITQVDKRSKFYKHFKDKIVEFNYLDTNVLVRYIQKECGLNEKNATRLAQLCENDYSRILLEIDKIKCYREAYNQDNSNETDDNQVLLWLIEDGTIYQPPKDAIFDFVDMVLRHNILKSFELLEDCKNVGEASMVMQSVLYNNVKHLLQVQSCDSKDISKSTGLSGWDIKLVRDKCGTYRNGQLVDALRLLRWIEKGIKTGGIEDAMSIEYFLVNFL